MQLRFQDITRRMQTEWIYASSKLGNLDECAGIGDWMNAAAAIEAALERLQSLLNASRQDATESRTESQFELVRWVRILSAQLKLALEGINARELQSEPSQRNLTRAHLLRHDIAQAIRELNAAADDCNGVQRDAFGEIQPEPPNAANAACIGVQANASCEADTETPNSENALGEAKLIEPVSIARLEEHCGALPRCITHSANLESNALPASEAGEAGAANVETQTQPTKPKTKRRPAKERLDEFVAKYGKDAVGMSCREWERETTVDRTTILKSEQWKTCLRIRESQKLERQRELKEEAKLVSRPNS